MSTLPERMDGDYEPPILREPVGGPIPTPPADDSEIDEESPDPEPQPSID